MYESQLNTPINISNGTEFIIPAPVRPTPLGTDMVAVINIYFQFEGKLDAYITHRATGTHSVDYNDLVYLVRHYTDDVYRCRAGFNVLHKIVFFQDYAALNANAPDVVAFFQRVLGLDV